MTSCLVAIARNEAPYVVEWALWHAFGGFDAVVIYDNASTDDTRGQALVAGRHADVRVIGWDRHPGQIEAYNDALDRFADEFDLFAMLDLDEFLVPLAFDSIADLLAATEGRRFTAVNWMVYGSNGHASRPDGLVTEAYTRRAARPNAHVKTILRPRGTPARFINPHVVAPADYVDLSGQPVAWDTRKPTGGKTGGPVATEIGRIHHYYTKSREDYLSKLDKGMATSANRRPDMFDWHESTENAVEDPILSERFAPVLDRIKAATGTGS